MPSIFFSPSTLGFYDHGQAYPDDAMAITTARHRSLLAGQSDGATIAAGPDGAPMLQRPAKPHLAERRKAALRLVKREAFRRIERVSPLWRQNNDLRSPSPDGEARFVEIDGIRAASAMIEMQIGQIGVADLASLDIAAHPAWPEHDR